MHKNSWETKAACASESLSDVDWFSNDTDEKYRARAICQSQCPVRKSCLQFALDQRMLYGIWGGVDDYEIRRAMSVDAKGEPSQRDRLPRCPYCLSKKLEISGQKTSKGYSTNCTECTLHWYMATIPGKLKNKKAA